MALRFGVGAEQAERPLTEHCAGAPDLLAVEQPPAVGPGGRRAQRRQVTAGFGFGPGLGPDLLTTGHFRQDAVALFFGAVREQRRRQHRGAVGAGSTRCTGPEVLLFEDHPLQQRRVSAAVAFRPGDDRQPRVEEHLVPAAMLFETVGGVVGLRRERVGVRGKELPHLGAEFVGGVVEREIHVRPFHFAVGEGV